MPNTLNTPGRERNHDDFLIFKGIRLLMLYVLIRREDTLFDIRLIHLHAKCAFSMPLGWCIFNGNHLWQKYFAVRLNLLCVQNMKCKTTWIKRIKNKTSFQQSISAGTAFFVKKKIHLSPGILSCEWMTPHLFNLPPLSSHSEQPLSLLAVTSHSLLSICSATEHVTTGTKLML